MMINETSKRVVPFEDRDARTVGAGCYYMDLIVWLNGYEIDMGDEVKFNYGCWVNGYGGMRIGDRTGFGPYVMIHTANHITSDPRLPILEQGWEKRPVVIGADCWFAMGVCILPGVTIGDRVIVGAGAVVAHDVPSNSLAVGNPARVIRTRSIAEESSC